MGFFSDLKEDLSQAVNELMPDEGTVNTADDAVTDTVTEEQTEDTLSLDAMLENIDAIEIPEELEADAESAEEKLADADELNAEITEDDSAPAGEEEFYDADEPETEFEERDPDWDLERMLENALTDRKVQTEEKTVEYKGAGKAMEMNVIREAVDETSVITAGMTITGDVVSEGSLDIIGTVNGNIDIMGKLNITGHIVGNSMAAEIYADGAKITGEIVSEGAVKIGASTVIVGNITATSAAIAGAVKGDIDVRGPVILDTSAIVMGNIKSKSVQINNGAVIEGMCSQCYADVSPTSFFEDYKQETKKDKTK